MYCKIAGSFVDFSAKDRRIVAVCVKLNSTHSMKRLFIVLAVLAPAFFTGCIKDNPTPPPPKDSTSIPITDTSTYTLVLQPDSTTGQDSYVSKLDNHDSDGNVNLNFAHELFMARYIFSIEGYDSATQRSYLRFDSLSKIPDTAVVLSATLYLYGESSSASYPYGNTYPTSFNLPNTSLIQRVTGGTWDQKTITWNNAPALTSTGQDTIPPSTGAYNYNVTIDVTNLVKPMVSSPSTNYGFGLRLITEQSYRSLQFSSSEASDPTLRPKLVVKYKK
jgi:hypothetical protein